MSTTEARTIPQPRTSEPRTYDTSTCQEHDIAGLEIVAWDSPRVSASIHVGTYGGTIEARQVNRDHRNKEPFVCVVGSVVVNGVRTEVKTFLTMDQAWGLLDSLTTALRP